MGWRISSRDGGGIGRLLIRMVLCGGFRAWTVLGETWWDGESGFVAFVDEMGRIAQIAADGWHH